MSTVSIFLLCIAAIFVIGIAGEIVFAKTGIPDVIWLILVGIVLVPVAGLVSKESLQAAAPYFGALTLVVVLFEGGSELQLGELSKAAGRGTLLAILGFILAVAFVVPVVLGASAVGILPESWGLGHAILVGTILGGSSSVVIMPALAKAGLHPSISNLVNLESALTDVLSVVATGVVVQLLSPASGAGGGMGDAGLTLGKTLGIGVALGIFAGLLAILVLRKLGKSSYAYPLTLGGLLVLFVIIDELGGSAALGILTAAVMVGNAPTLSKAIGLAKTARLGANVKGVHGEITFIIKSFFFCFIGAMLGPREGQSLGEFFPLLIFGVVIGLVLFAARIPNIIVSTAKSTLSKEARTLVSVLFPRGMAAGVLALWPHQMGIADTQDLPVIIFAAVFTTILLFAGGFPVLRKRLPASDLLPVVDKTKLPHGPAADASQSAIPGQSAAAANATAPVVEAPFVQTDVPVGEAQDQLADGSALPPETGLSVDIPFGPADATAVDPNAGPGEGQGG